MIQALFLSSDIFICSDKMVPTGNTGENAYGREWRNLLCFLEQQVADKFWRERPGSVLLGGGQAAQLTWLFQLAQNFVFNSLKSQWRQWISAWGWKSLTELSDSWDWLFSQRLQTWSLVSWQVHWVSWTSASSNWCSSDAGQSWFLPMTRRDRACSRILVNPNSYMNSWNIWIHTWKNHMNS